MVTVNETGPHKGRLLFTVVETAQAASSVTRSRPACRPSLSEVLRRLRGLK
jgi:hypothetical protein